MKTLICMCCLKQLAALVPFRINACIHSFYHDVFWLEKHVLLKDSLRRITGKQILD